MNEITATANFKYENNIHHRAVILSGVNTFLGKEIQKIMHTVLMISNLVYISVLCSRDCSSK